MSLNPENRQDGNNNRDNEHGPEGDDSSGTEAVEEGAGNKTGPVVDHRKEREDTRCGSAAPSEFLQHGNEKDGEGIPDPHGNRKSDKGDADDFPTIEQFFSCHSL